MSVSPFNALTNQFAGSIDPVNDAVAFWQSSTSEAFWINQNTFLNLTSQPVGINDTQVLTNKTLTTPTISGPTLSGTVIGTYTIGGTPTFPASVATLTGTQTLTNKTITAPAITGGTVANAAITADSISGYTTPNTGTIFGASITAGILSAAALAAGSITSATLAANAVLSGKLGLSSGYTGGVQTLANTGSAGGTVYYVNLGGIKLLWGSSGSITVGTGSNGPYDIAYPSSFFSTIQYYGPLVQAVGATASQYTSGNSTSITDGSFYIASAGTGTATVGWLVIGT